MALPTNAYCTVADVVARQTLGGNLSANDRDGDGIISDGEYARHEKAIEYAGAIIDSYISTERVVDTIARAGALAGTIPSLKMIAVDLAVYRETTDGNRQLSPNDPYQIAYDEAMAMLQRFANGERIPGYPYLNTANTGTGNKYSVQRFSSR